MKTFNGAALIVSASLSLLINSPLWCQNEPPSNLQVSATSNQSSDGYEYDYKFKNVGDKDLMRIQLFTPEEQTHGRMPAIRKCWAPKGWMGSASKNPMNTIIIWVANGNAGGDLPPGQELAGFGFVSDASPGTVTLTASDVSMAMFKGQTSGPSVDKTAASNYQAPSVSINCETK